MQTVDLGHLEKRVDVPREDLKQGEQLIRVYGSSPSVPARWSSNVPCERVAPINCICASLHACECSNVNQRSPFSTLSSRMVRPLRAVGGGHVIFGFASVVRSLASCACRRAWAPFVDEFATCGGQQASSIHGVSLRLWSRRISEARRLHLGSLDRQRGGCCLVSSVGKMTPTVRIGLIEVQMTLRQTTTLGVHPCI